MDKLVLPCNIGDIVYIVRDRNPYSDDELEYFITKYNTKVVVEEFTVTEFIFDDSGFHISSNTWDGYVKLEHYHNLTLKDYGDCKIFTTLEGAAKYLDTICD